MAFARKQPLWCASQLGHAKRINLGVVSVGEEQKQWGWSLCSKAEASPRSWSYGAGREDEDGFCPPARTYMSARPQPGREGRAEGCVHACAPTHARFSDS